MSRGSIDWFALYGSFILLIFLVEGATLCISPVSFVKAHRTLFPKNPVSNTAKWEAGICNTSGRLAGAMHAGFAIFMLYKLWSGGIR